MPRSPTTQATRRTTGRIAGREHRGEESLPVDVSQMIDEETVAKCLKTYEEALEAETVVRDYDKETGRIIYGKTVPDWTIRLAAANKLWEYKFGKAAQRHQVEVEKKEEKQAQLPTTEELMQSLKERSVDVGSLVSEYVEQIPAAPPGGGG